MFLLRSKSSPYGVSHNGQFTIIKNMVTGSIICVEHDPDKLFHALMCRLLIDWYYDISTEQDIKQKRRALRNSPFPNFKSTGMFTMPQFNICSFQCRTSVKAVVFTLNIASMRRDLPRLPLEIIIIILEMIKIEEYGPTRPQLQVRGRLLPFFSE
mgnify:CR=1 FL=1|jgi:hypothetical protein